MAAISGDDHEANILVRLSCGPASYPGKNHVIQLLDRFNHVGPNGNHSCLILELLGPRLDVQAERYTDNRLPGYLAWEACRQTALAIEYIHANGIAHGGQSDNVSSDHTANILLL